MKRIDIALMAGVALAVLLTSFVSFAKDCGTARQGVVRLHILANSDSEADQALKLAVRDRILEETAELFSAAESKEDAKTIAAAELLQIERIAREEILRQSYDYDVKAELVNMFFETRSYDDVTLPSGRYDAVRVCIGKAQGKNWWCVLFPPLCLPAASGQNDLPIEEQLRQLGETPRYVPKLAVLELIEDIQEKFDSGEDASVIA